MYSAIRIQSSSARRRARITSFGRAVDNTVETLESRWLFAVTATSGGGVLTVMGDNNANAIIVSRDAAGSLRVNNGAVQIVGSAATVANTTLIKVLGADGNDTISLDETLGPLPKASLSGGNGNDTLTGGSAADTLNGDAGNDLLLGKAGDDQLLGGSGNDTLTGGVGTDQALGQSGDDRMIWNPGDGSDLNEGGDGVDTVEISGGGVSEAFSADSVGSRVLFKRIDPLPFTVDIGTSEKLLLNANAGDDSFFGGTGLAKLMAVTINGNDGNDTLVGTDGNDTLTGGNGNDFVDGNAGTDAAFLGAGNDVFRWDPGDGSDRVEGQAGTDQMIFNGAKIKEKIDLSANGGRLRFFRDVGNITMNTNDVETVAFNAIGGGDDITVHDLKGTDVRLVNINLEGSPGAGDGRENVIVEGSSVNDLLTITSDALRGVSVAGLTATVAISGAEAADKLNLNMLGGNDIVNALGLQANAILLNADGGSGNDVLIGGAGNDTLHGGDGNDVLIGAGGIDLLDGGAADDILIQ